MKKIYNVSNTIENGTGLVRQWSRITRFNSRIWTVIAPMLFVAFGLFGVNEKAWATWPTYSGSCSTSGYVLNDACNNRTSALTTYEFELNLAGPGDELTFKAKITDNSVGTNLKIYQYVGTGYQDTPIFDRDKPGKWQSGILGRVKNADYDTYTVSVSALATKIKFVFVGSLNKNIRDVSVTRYSDNAYALYTSPVDCGSADYNLANSADKYTTGTAYVDWSHIATAPTCSISGSQASYFEVKTKTNTPTTNTYGVMSVQVAYKHTAPGDHSATLNVGGKTITVKGHTNKITPYIVTTPTVDTITYRQTISNSQLGTGLVKADLINAAGTVVPGTWTIDENGQIVTTSGGSNATVHLTFAPTDVNTYDTIHTTQLMFVRSVATISWASAYSAEKPTVPVGKWIENAATTNAAGAVITYSSTSPDVEISADGRSFRFTAESEAEIVASHGVTATHGSASETKTFKSTYKAIQVIKWADRFDRLTTEMTSKSLIAEVWIENALTGVRTYSAERTALLQYSSANSSVVSIPVNSTTLHIEGKGTTTITAFVEGDEYYEEASVTMPVKVREPSDGCDYPLWEKDHEGDKDHLYEFFQMNKNEIISPEYDIRMEGQYPDKLSFSHKGEYYNVVGISFWKYYSGPIKAQQKIGDNWVNVTGSEVTPALSDWQETSDLQLDERATHIRFVRPQGGEGHHYIKNVTVSRKHFIRTETPEVDFGNTIKVNSSEYRDVVINYANVQDVLKVTNPFSQDITVDDVIDVDSCGAAGSAVLRIYFSPTSLATVDDYITIKDEVKNNTLSIHVKADAQRADQTITWNPETNILATESILLNGTTNGQEHDVMNVITYTVTNNDDVISVVNNVVTILKPGTVTITATQNGSANYEAADPVEKNFTISAETLTIMESPIAGDITYGQTLSASTLTGGSVEDSKHNPVAGSFSWQAASTQPNAGSAQEFVVVFTPYENAAWYNTLTTSVAVNVAVATPTATPSAANIVYGQKVNESELSNEGTAGTWSWTDEKAEDVLEAGTYNDLAVHFKPTSGNYTELDATVTLTVEKANPEVTAQASAITYGQAISASELSTATGNISGTWAWAVDKTQVLSVGNHALKANFTSANANYNDLSNVNVTLTVNKIETLEVDVALSFCAGGEVTFHGNTYTEAGEYHIEAEGEIRDTVYNVTVTKLQPTTGTDSKTITVGANESWNGNDLSGYAIGSHEVVFHTENVAGCDSTVTLSLTVVPATNVFTNAEGDGDWGNANNWESGIVPTSDPDIIVTGALEINGSITVGSLTIESTGSVAVISGGTLTVKGTSENRTEYGNMYVENGGEVEVNGGLRVGDLTVEASIGTSDGSAESGQVDNAENIVYANAYIEINMDPSGVVDGNKWYGFTVPFEVSARNGISRKVGSTYQNCSYGTDYIIAEYDAAKRLSSGKGWKNLSGNTLNAGQFYYFGGDGGYNTYRFKASGNTYTPITEKTLSMNGTGPDANWNAVGNSTLQHATASFEGGGYVQVYQNGLDAYKTVATNEATFVVGCPFFIQASESATLALSVPTDPSEKYYAPRRVQEAQTSVLRINLTAIDGGYSDQIYVSGVQKEQDGYVLGHDLSKAGLSTEIPQLWVDAYGQKLSVHEAALYGNNAYCTLGLYAPMSGEYLLTATKPSDNTQIFLTIDGMPVWNITESDYVVTLNKGTNNSYGLMIMNAPRVTTGIDSIEDDNTKGSKMMIDGLLYILKNGQMYDATGKKIK